MAEGYITPEVRAVIGAESAWEEACHPVQESEVRRFFQATMDFHPRYWDIRWATASRYGRVVAPPAFPVHMFKRPPSETVDPLDSMEDPDFDGVSRRLRPGLPTVPVKLARILNGGYDYEFYSYARVGERVMMRSRYRDIYEREGRSGALVFVMVEDEYRTVDGRPLLTSVNANILR